MDKLEELKITLDNDALSRDSQSRNNFIYAQTSQWLSILTSFITSILAIEESNKYVVAGLAAFSAMIIVINKQFHYSARATYYKLYFIALKRLKNELKDIILMK